MASLTSQTLTLLLSREIYSFAEFEYILCNLNRGQAVTTADYWKYKIGILWTLGIDGKVDANIIQTISVEVGLVLDLCNECKKKGVEIEGTCENYNKVCSIVFRDNIIVAWPACTT